MKISCWEKIGLVVLVVAIGLAMVFHRESLSFLWCRL